jgi:nucleoside-diphosphate-sugar epimerase
MIDPRTDRVLITGAAGEIGTALRDGLRANLHRLRLTDIRPVQNLTDNEMQFPLKSCEKLPKGLVHLLYAVAPC